MKMQILSLAAIVFLVGSIFNFFSANIIPVRAGSFFTGNAEKVAVAEEKKDPVEEILKTMTLEEKVGQMMMIGVYGKTVDENIKSWLTKYHFGGVIFFDRNMESKEQVKKFSDELQAVSNEKIPLFIAVDEEGGKVARMKDKLVPPLAQEEIGSTGDPNLARLSAESISRDLRDIGINLNFAPVADVGTTDTRSFSSDSKIVAKFVDSAAQGYEMENLFYCLKHFPGLGRGKVDTHKDISVVDADKKTLFDEDIFPFQKIISEHDNSKFMVMVGHLKYTALDSENAASLSEEIITKILRDDLKFQGVIVTDDLNMGAVSKYNDMGSIVVKTIKAGSDIALVCHEYELQKKACEAILNAVKTGEISEERINESVRRILKMKLNL